MKRMKTFLIYALIIVAFWIVGVNEVSRNLRIINKESFGELLQKLVGCGGEALQYEKNRSFFI